MPQWYQDLREAAGPELSRSPEVDKPVEWPFRYFRRVVCEWFPPGTFTNPPWNPPTHDDGITLHEWERIHGSSTGKLW